MKDRLALPDGRPPADFLPTITIKAGAPLEAEAKELPKQPSKLARPKK